MITPVFITFRGKVTWLCRMIAAFLIPALLLTCPSIVEAADQAADQIAQDRADKLIHPDPVVSPSHVTVNRTQPVFTPPSSTFTLPIHPTDQDILSHSLFEEPLVPLGGKTSLAENTALGQALRAFASRSDRDDFSGLEGFLSSYPHSVWRIALLTDLGWSYRQTGWYSKAMTAWQDAWTAGQVLTTPDAKPIVDRALVELIVMNARVGRVDVLKQLIAQAETRHLVGSSKEKLEAAKQAVVLMKTRPDTSFRCGPMAVEKIRNILDKNDPSKRKIMSMPSTNQGTNMLQLKKLAAQLGMDYQVAKRTPGAQVIAPAVVNWKVGHFAALAEAKGKLWHLRDPTFGNDVWISAQALDAEASGYFLVKKGPLPQGWSLVSDQEASRVWGKGNNGGGDANCNGGPTPKSGCPGTGGGGSSPGSPSGSSQAPGGNSSSGGTNGMARYAFYEMLASLCVQDTPLFYSPPYGPKVEFTVTYSQRESNQPSTFTYSNLGPLWTFNWLSYLVDDPANPGADVNHYLSGGGTLVYTGYNSGTQTYSPQAQTGCVLKITSSTSYELDEPDGSKQIFAAANTASPRKVFMTQTIDPQGNGLTFGYDSSFRLVSVTDAMGQVSTLTYGLTGDPYKITKVTDPFGRTALLNYTTGGTLQSTTDMLGLVSTYGYSYAEGVLSSLTTPYGTTTFSTGQNTDTGMRWIQATDPQGGQERIETWNNTAPSSVPSSAPAAPSGVDNAYLEFRNTFYWDKKAMLNDATGLVYTDAVITHWLHEPDYNVMSDQVEGIKPPLENRTYYNYPNQPLDSGGEPIVTGSSGQASRITRILDDGSTQQTLATYNSVNNLIQSTDALNRVTNYNYAANGVDLLSVTQLDGSNQDTLASATYNSQHEPLTTTDASGQATHYAYYPDGQLKTITDPIGEITTFAYSNGSSGYLTSITGAQAGATTTLAYDGYGRISSVTDVNNYTLNYAYDNLNRQTKVTYPDGTYDENVYTNFDRILARDRQGRWTRYLYNPLEQVVAVIDSADRVTNYSRCICGELTAITDPLLHKTSFAQDIEGRTINKTFPDSSQVQYGYENSTSRLKTVTDATGQVTTYSYNEDNTVAQMVYTNATVATPTVSFTYDPVYPRLTKMVDGTGTTTYVFNPITTTPTLGAGRLGSETGPLGNTATIAYTYDQLGRTTGTAINSVSSSIVYDSLGRITNATNALGGFTYGYYGVTPRLETLTYPNGQSTSYQYLSTTQDLRLSEIKNLTPSSAVLSQNDYTYNEVGTIASWQQQTDSNTPTIWNYKYDGADQLLSAVKTNTSTQTVLNQYFYGYDLGANRTTEQIGMDVTQSVFNNLNEKTSSSAGGTLHVTGTLNKAGTATVAGNPAAVDANDNFSGTTSVTTGTNSFAVVATNLNGYAATNKYQVVIPANTTITPSYDLNGNLMNNAAGQTYSWDAKNELVKITYSGGATSAFTYDGRGRRASIIEKNSSGTVTSTKQFVWIGNEMAEERDATGTNVTKRFFAQGEQIAGANYYYTRDHLGSVRELTSSAGAIAARYDYDPYGRPSLIQGTNLADFQYAGYYEHETSGLNLTKYRAYDPNTAKWLSRDPAGMRGGLDLYDYCLNDPVASIDEYGLCPGKKDCGTQIANLKTADAALLEATKALGLAGLQASAAAAKFALLAAAAGFIELATITACRSGPFSGPCIIGLYAVYKVLKDLYQAENDLITAEEAELKAANAEGQAVADELAATDAVNACESGNSDPSPPLN